MRICPYCAEWIQDEAALCRFCGKILDASKLPEPHVRCPVCGEWVLARAKRCQYCSQSLAPSNLSTFVPETTAAEAAQLNNDRAAPDGHREVDLDQPIRVLLVDDILEVREKVRAMLHKAGDIRVVGEAGTGEEGLARYAELRPEVVCTNICMPGMNGIKMTKEIYNKFPEAQVFILSVQNEVDYMRNAMLAGARDFLAKPPSEDELVAVVRKLGRDYRAKQAEQGAHQGKNARE